jgi:hypothetical protein
MTNQRKNPLTIVVLMIDGEHRTTTYPNIDDRDFKAAVERACRDAIQAGPVREAVIISSTYISKYTRGEVLELANTSNTYLVDRGDGKKVRVSIPTKD